MSDSISTFIEDVGNQLDQTANDVETGIRDVANTVEQEGNDVINAVNNDTGEPSTTSPAAQITRLYDTVLDRAPDDVGLTFWTNALRSGVGLNDVAEVFVASSEFRERYGDLETGEFVGLLYRNVLDREADPEGQAFWTSGIESGGFDRNDVVLAFSESEEHVAKIGPVSTGDNALI